MKEIKQAIKEMETLMTRLQKFGASDTEPDGVWQGLLLAAVDGQEVDVPQTAREWQLFTDMDRVEEAAECLYKKANRVVRMIQKAPISQVKDLRIELQEYCWRY